VAESSGLGELIYSTKPSYPIGVFFRTKRRIDLFRWSTIVLAILILLLGYFIFQAFPPQDFSPVWVFIMCAGLILAFGELFSRDAIESAQSVEIHQNGILLCSFPWYRMTGRKMVLLRQDITKLVVYRSPEGFSRWKRKTMWITRMKLKTRSEGTITMKIGNHEERQEVLRILSQEWLIPTEYKVDRN
jgi:hypothetical protein